MNTRPLRFFHRGEVVSLPAPPATRSVLDWLREDRHCTGTKEGCAEGDCGACTVVLGELGAHGQLLLKPVNACIQFLPTLDGKALFTVEDLGDLGQGEQLHPVQQAMVDCHGSQCGFCTPGFVMSLWAGYERCAAGEPVPSRQQLADDLSGNLCRCTGYRPILDAGQQAYTVPRVALDRAPVVAALRALQAEAQAQPLQTPNFHAPRTLAAFAELRAALPQARVLAGCTDIGLWVNKQFRDVGTLLYIGEVAELKAIREEAGSLWLGAAATLEAAWAALAEHWPSLREVGLRFASRPIREAGTLGGNIANGSPIGDGAPVLMALGAAIELRLGERVRRLPLADFYLDYMKNRLEPGEFVQALVVPLPVAGAAGAAGDGTAVRAYKISKRFDCDISAVCAGLAVQVHHGAVAQARFAFGGLAATVRHARQAEAAVQGQPWTEATVQAAMAALAQDFSPLTDQRASAAYRLQVAQNLLLRLWLETRPDAPLPPQATTVWAREVQA